MIRFSIAALMAAGACTAAFAQAETNFSRQAYQEAKAEIKSTFKGERRACDGLKGNPKAVCVEEAKGGERVALAQLQLDYTGSPDAEIALYRAQYDAQYAVDTRRCADRTGSDKDICVQQAKTERDKARADAKMAKRINQAVLDDTRARLKADYALAREKCDALADDAKEVCIVSAKARYSEGW